MSEPRGVEDRLDWMLDHPPGQVGMCARETWQALGGDLGQPCPPAWGTPDANAVYDKVIASGRYWTGSDIPRGAAIFWKYGNYGHAALSFGDGKIVTTDPTANRAAPASSRCPTRNGGARHPVNGSTQTSTTESGSHRGGDDTVWRTTPASRRAR